jgi:hypothetical protein
MEQGVPLNDTKAAAPIVLTDATNANGMGNTHRLTARPPKLRRRSRSG